MFDRLAIATIVLAATAFGATLVLDRIPSSLPAGEVPADQGWRRTSHGWEQLSPRIVTASPCREHNPTTLPRTSANSLVQPAMRLDFHPAIMALAMVLGAIAAFCLFPNATWEASRIKSQSLFY